MNSYEDELYDRLNKEQNMISKQIEIEKAKERSEFARQRDYNKRLRIAEVNFGHLAVAACNLASQYDLPNYPLVDLISRGSGKPGRADQIGRITLASEIGLINYKIYERPSLISINNGGTIYYNSTHWNYYASTWRSKDKKVVIKPYKHIGEYLSVDDDGRAILKKSSFNRDHGTTSNWTVDVEEFVMSNLTKAIAQLRK